MTVDINKHYTKVANLLTREIEGELIIIPLHSGIGNLDSEVFSLNSTGMLLWEKLDGQNSLKNIINAMIDEFDSNPRQIKNDILELIEQLIRKKLIITK